ncbi:transposase [bacterium]|nr:transposase [bacterium]
MCFTVEEELKGWYKRSGIPHYDCDKVYQSITLRLHDSVPQHVIEQWKDELYFEKLSSKDSKAYRDLQRKIFTYEDNGYGECYLKIPAIKKIVEDAFKYFDKVKYDLIEYVIMPNHVHVLILPYQGQSLPAIIHSWKSFTAKKANKILNRTGKFWMEDYYDRYIRDVNHFDKVVKYIRNNGKEKGR